MKPIFITDLDHTLLRSDHSIGEYTQNMWSSRVEDSILSIATARSFSKSREFLSKLELKYPLILLDGAIVVSPDKEPIDLKIISRDLADGVIVEGAKLGIYPFVIGLKDSELNEGFRYTDRLNPIQKSVLENYKSDPRLEYHRELRAMDMTLKIVYFGEKEELYPLRNHLIDIFKDELEYKLSPENYTKGYFLTILHPKADKSYALLEVCNYLQRDILDVTVFGDSLNDIGMFTIAGKSVAVSNALDEVKDRADRVLEYSNDEEGVARYIMSVR